MNHRNFFHHIYILALAMAVILVSTSCLWAHTGHKHGKESLQISLPDVLAKVGDTDIKKETILEKLKKAVELYQARGVALTPDQQKTTAKKILDKEISKTLLLKRGKELGIAVTAASGSKLREALNKVIETDLKSRIQIDPQEIKDHYENNIDNFRKGEQVRASVILLKAGPDASEAEDKTARDKIDSIAFQVEGGAAFSELAQKFSQDSLRSRGGDLGYLEKRRMFPEFSKRAFNMKAGEVSEVFKTRHGYHLLKVTGKKPAYALSFEEAENQIKTSLIRKKLKEETPAYIEELKRKAGVKIYF